MVKVATKRFKNGRFKPCDRRKRTAKKSSKAIDHEYCLSDGRVSSEPLELGEQHWRLGRRVVEFGCLLDSLRSCTKCKLGPVPLTADSVIGELRKGLGGYLYVRCGNHDCQHVNRVPYGKTHRQSSKGMPCFVINTKLGTAMIDSLGGPGRVNNALSTLDLPIIPNRNLQKMEARAGKQIEELSKESSVLAAKTAFEQEMEDVAERETQAATQSFECMVEDLGVGIQPESSPGLKKILTSLESQENEDDQWSDVEDSVPSTSSISNIDPPAVRIRPRQDISSSKRTLTKYFPCITQSGMSSAVDTGYQKRGFDSLTGHTFFMSKSRYGKKVVKTLVKHRRCGVCMWWAKNRKGQPVRKHSCVKNHCGSARAMESASGVKGVLELQQEGTPVEYLEGDGDNTLIAHLRDRENIHMKKRFDKNHVVKNFGKHLYKLKNEKTVKISGMIIDHLQKCLSYSFAKNAGDKQGLEENLKALIPHQFGDHSICQPRFCGFKRNTGDRYVHRSLPYKTALKDMTLKTHLMKMMEPYIANVEQYIDMGSSQQCEHANREVSIRAPKNFHYGNTESLDYRVHATAAFINEGRSYIAKTHSRANLSPGYFTQKYAKKCQKHRVREQERVAQPATKRRRLMLKQERKMTQGAHEVQEGATYQSGIGHEKEADITAIPKAVPKGDFKPATMNAECRLISFDLETTDLIRGRIFPQITQIAATDIKTGRCYNEYVLPTVPVTRSAEQVTGISVIGGNMLVDGQPVTAIGISTALESFCDWLGARGTNVLVAHNGRRFDFPILIHTCKKVNHLDNLLSCAPVGIDTLPVMKKVYPGRSSYAQGDLVRDLLGETYKAHDAAEDVRMLGKLVSLVTIDKLQPFSFSTKAVFLNQVFSLEKARNMPSLSVLVANGICKTATAENIAGSGLNIEHLRTICKRDGEDGLQNIFSMKNSEGHPRVTNTKRVLETVVPALVEFFKSAPQ